MIMQSKKSQNIEFDKLELDLANKRYNKIAGPFDTEEAVIDYMLKFESLEKLINSIQQTGYENDEALWVIKNGSKYLVKEGNRRLCALKVLANPTLYQDKIKNLRKYTIRSVFCSIYTDEKALDNRIITRHTQNSIKGWNRLAQAFQIQAEFKKHQNWDKVSGGSSKKTLYRMANFYEEAHKIYSDISKTFACEDEGKSKFEIWDRLFGFNLPKQYFGFTFRNNEIKILNTELFSQFIEHTTKLLLQKSTIVSSDIEKDKIDTLMENYFPIFYVNQQGQDSGNHTLSNKSIPAVMTVDRKQKGSQKKKPIGKSYPDIQRTNIEKKVLNVIDECYKLKSLEFPNAKLAMSRIVLEATLKDIIEKIRYKEEKPMKDSNYFRSVYYDKHGNKRAYMDFNALSNLFAEIIISKGRKKELLSFDIERTHQIIHNNRLSALAHDAQTAWDNLVPLLSFLLQDENSLLKELDLKKLP